MSKQADTISGPDVDPVSGPDVDITNTGINVDINVNTDAHTDAGINAEETVDDNDEADTVSGPDVCGYSCCSSICGCRCSCVAWCMWLDILYVSRHLLGVTYMDRQPLPRLSVLIQFFERQVVRQVHEETIFAQTALEPRALLSGLHTCVEDVQIT